MERNDLITSREEILLNIKTLYSYLNGDQGNDYKTWAVSKMKRGKNFVVEIIDSNIYFAPSRFVVTSTIQKTSTMKIMEMVLKLTTR